MTLFSLALQSAVRHGLRLRLRACSMLGGLPLVPNSLGMLGCMCVLLTPFVQEAYADLKREKLTTGDVRVHHFC